MILQRLATSIRKQDWFTVLIETLIVVLGVFLGIQLGNWNEARADSARETALLVQLRSEVETSMRATEQKADAVWQVVQAGKRSLDFMESGASCGDECWPVIVDFFHASQWQPIDVNRSTYDEMRRQGLPSSRAVIDAIEKYLAHNINLTRAHLLPPYRSTVRQMISLDAQAHYWTTCFTLQDGAEIYALDCPEGISDKESAQIVDRIISNPDVALQLTEWAGLMWSTPSDMREQNEAAQLALAVIDAELERRK